MRFECLDVCLITGQKATLLAEDGLGTTTISNIPVELEISRLSSVEAYESSSGDVDNHSEEIW